MKDKDIRETSVCQKLANGLDLVMTFKRIHAAGDRYQVIFEAVINVGIRKEYLEHEMLGDIKPDDVRRLLGERTTYIYSKTRNFIAGSEKEDVLENLKQQFLDTGFSYISSPVFPLKLIRRSYMTAVKEEMIRLKREEFLKPPAL